MAKEDLKPGEIAKKANHLKLNGCIKTVKSMECAPELLIVSEFWGGKDDIRMFIVKRICEGIRHSPTFTSESDEDTTYVIAGDIGLNIALDTKKIICSSCGAETNINKVKTMQNEKYGRLKYVCSKCSN